MKVSIPFPMCSLSFVLRPFSFIFNQSDGAIPQQDINSPVSYNTAAYRRGFAKSDAGMNRQIRSAAATNRQNFLLNFYLSILSTVEIFLSKFQECGLVDSITFYFDHVLFVIYRVFA